MKAGLASEREEREVVAAVYIPHDAEKFLGTLRRLCDDCKLPIVLGTPRTVELGSVANLAVECLETRSAAELVNQVWTTTGAHVLAVHDAVSIPPQLLDRAVKLMRDDLRVATVSFFSNAASFLSFPHRNRPIGCPPEGTNEVTITGGLRSRQPVLGAVPIPLAAGSPVLLSATALGVVGPLEDGPSGSLAAALADFCSRGRSRGFVDLLDPTTFCARLLNRSVDPDEMLLAGLRRDDDDWFRERHPTIHALVEQDRMNPDSPLGLALAGARASALGLHVIIDGSCLGPLEMGTQVATVALINALATRPDVQEVCVTLPGPVPDYARDVLAAGKVRVVPVTSGERPLLGRFDVAHRPFQPNEGFSVREWREVADRVVVTVHDLISFHIGTYSGDTGVWLRYRDVIRESTHDADGVIVVSDDVLRQMQLQRLPIDWGRVFVVPNGTEHLTGTEATRMPDALVASGFTGGQFLLCLGTDYSHKNRDLAVRTWMELRGRGRELALVLAGPAMPWGSSRALEADCTGESGFFVLPNVTAEERNWLLRHTALVLYPTSAEGFGLVPFEAATFGTPTVHVGFGPLADVVGTHPGVARDWHPRTLAEKVEALLADPALAAEAVESCLKIGKDHTWAKTAELLTAAYRDILARQPASGPG